MYSKNQAAVLPVSYMKIRAGLIHFRESVLTPEFGEENRSSGILRKSNLLRILSKLPKTEDELKACLGSNNLNRTDPTQFAHSKKVLEIIQTHLIDIPASIKRMLPCRQNKASGSYFIFLREDGDMELLVKPDGKVIKVNPGHFRAIVDFEAEKLPTAQVEGFEKAMDAESSEAERWALTQENATKIFAELMKDPRTAFLSLSHFGSFNGHFSGELQFLYNLGRSYDTAGPSPEDLNRGKKLLWLGIKNGFYPDFPGPWLD